MLRKKAYFWLLAALLAIGGLLQTAALAVAEEKAPRVGIPSKELLEEKKLKIRPAEQPPRMEERKMTNRSALRSSMSFSAADCSADTVMIQDAEALYKISVSQAVYSNSCIELANDIDFTGWNWSDSPWIPIGNTSTGGNPFTGTFNGNHKTIKGLKVYWDEDMDWDGSEVGMFAKVVGGTIQNVTLDDVDITGYSNVGSVVNQIDAGTIDNVHVSGKIRGLETIGGLVSGLNYGSIKNSTADVEIRIVYRDSVYHVGGLAGYVYEGTITKSRATGSIEVHGNAGDVKYIGGVVGESAYSIIEENSSNMNISINDITGEVSNIGGLIGENYSSDILKSDATGSIEIVDADYYVDSIGGVAGSSWYTSKIKESSSDINISIKGISSDVSSIGGLVGYNRGGFTEVEFSDISKSKASGSIEIVETKGTVSRVGGASGYNYHGSMNNGSVDIKIMIKDGTDDVSSIGGLAGSTEVLTIADSHAAGSIEILENGGNVSGIGGLSGYNDKKSHIDMSSANVKININIRPFSSTGMVGGLVGGNEASQISESDSVTSIEISNANGAFCIGGLVGCNASGNITKSTAIGTIATRENAQAESVGGLVGSSDYSEITWSVANTMIEITDSYYVNDIGGFAGMGYESVISDSDASGSIMVSKIDKTGEWAGYIGGLVGKNYSTITDSSTTANISVIGFDNTENIGGLAGENFLGKINSSSSYSDITVSDGELSNIGGLIGYNNAFEDEIANSFAAGNIRASDYINIQYVGGLVGVNENTPIDKCYAIGDIVLSGGGDSSSIGGLVGIARGTTIRNSFAAGSLSGSDPIGGLVGEAADSEIENAIWNAEISDQDDAIGSYDESVNISDNVFGSTTEMMRTQVLFENWDFADEWSIVEGQTYPYLQSNPHLMLLDLQVNGTLVEGFNPYRPGTYRVDKPVKTATAKVSATTLKDANGSPLMNMEGIGDIGLNIGVNSIPVTVSKKDGFAAVSYNLEVKRETDNSGGSNGNGGGGSGGNGKVESKDGSITIPPGKGGVVSLGDDITVTIPEGASDAELRMTIKKLVDLAGLQVNRETLLSDVYEILSSLTGKFSKEITLTFVFDPTKLKQGQRAAIFYYDESKQVWVEIGGKSDGSKISVQVDHLTKFAVFAVDEKSSSGNTGVDEASVKLSDIRGHWAEASIRKAASIGFVKGYSDGTFKPNGTVTRAEFASMLARALSLQGNGEALDFADAASIGQWAKQAVAQAVQAGIISGYRDGSFRPNANISRAEMVSMIVRALRMTIDDRAVTSFADDEQIPPWAKGAIALAAERGIVSGRGGDHRFAPGDTATRAEAVVVLLNMLDVKNK